ncbi:MAG: hypothetical protein U0586_01200 [Candidatus Brocadiaceae bacterium]
MWRFLLIVAALAAALCPQIVSAQEEEFEVRQLPITVSVVPVKDYSELDIDKSLTNILEQRMETGNKYIRPLIEMEKVGKLKRIKEIPMKMVDVIDDVISEIGSFQNKLWGIESLFSYSKYLVSINPKTGKILKKFPCPGVNTQKNTGLGVSDTDLWVTNTMDFRIYRVDQKTGKVKKTYNIKGSLVDIFYGGTIDKDGNFWFGQWDAYGDSGGCKVFKLDTTTQKITQILQISKPKTLILYDVALDQKGNIYVTVMTSDFKYLILKLDPVKLKVLDTFKRNPEETTLTFIGEKLMTADWWVLTEKYFLYRVPK